MRGTKAIGSGILDTWFNGHQNGNSKDLRYWDSNPSLIVKRLSSSSPQVNGLSGLFSVV